MHRFSPPRRGSHPRTLIAALLLIVLIATCLLLSGAFSSQIRAAEPPIDSRADEVDIGLSGDYLGSQDGNPFKMTLRQDGRFVTGSVAFDRGGVDTLYGIFHGVRLSTVRSSSPFEIWLGQVELPRIAGEWIGPGAAGRWAAEKLGAHLSVTNEVSPERIPVRMGSRRTAIGHADRVRDVFIGPRTWSYPTKAFPNGSRSPRSTFAATRP